MKKLLVSLVLMLCFVACSAAGSLTGTWTTRSSSGSGFQFRLVDSEGSVTGGLYLVSSSGAYTYGGPVTGTRTGSDFALTTRLSDGSGSVKFTGSRSGSGLTGNFYLYNSSGNYVTGVDDLSFADAGLKVTATSSDTVTKNQLLEEIIRIINQ